MHVSSFILSEYNPLLLTDDVSIEEIGQSIPIPTFSHTVLQQLCTEARSYLAEQPALLDISGRVTIIGDLHGNIRDTIRVITASNWLMSNTILLFLGDYVDRGSFSVEVITLLLSLMLEFPNRVYLLRGNHEDREVNKTYGFRMQIMEDFGDETLWTQFNSVFDYLSIAAIVNGNIFCVHGGISKHLKKLTQISTMQKPIPSCMETDLLCDLMWSDPNPEYPYFQESARGMGSLFGCVAALRFMKEFSFKNVIRAHQCVKNGIEMFANGMVITVFSSSNYIGNHNMCGYLTVLPEEDNRLHFRRLPSLSKPLTRSEAIFRRTGEASAKHSQVHALVLPMLSVTPAHSGRMASYARKVRPDIRVAGVLAKRRSIHEYGTPLTVVRRRIGSVMANTTPLSNHLKLSATGDQDESQKLPDSGENLS